MPMPLNLPLGFDLQFPELVRGHEGRMGVQGPQGALDGAIDQVFGRLGLGILFLNEGQSLGEDFQLGVADGRRGERGLQTPEPTPVSRRVLAKDLLRVRRNPTPGPSPKLRPRHPKAMISVTSSALITLMRGAQACRVTEHPGYRPSRVIGLLRSRSFW